MCDVTSCTATSSKSIFVELSWPEEVCSLYAQTVQAVAKSANRQANYQLRFHFLRGSSHTLIPDMVSVQTAAAVNTVRAVQPTVGLIENLGR